MAKSFEDRRQLAGDVPEQVEEECGVDRRQFPPPEDPSTMTAAAVELQDAIDTYKIQRRLKRITVVELLGLLDELGYRRG
jgi:hypothetical protein